MQLVTDSSTLDRIRWDTQKKEFVFKRNKKTVTSKQLGKMLASQTKRYAIRQQKLARRLVNEEITFEQWQELMIDLVRKQHVEMARFAKGGKQFTFADDYLAVGREVKAVHYPALRKFAQQIKDGSLTTKQIEYRAMLYANSTKTTFEVVRRNQYTPDYQARRHLGSCADHCEPCKAYAREGWVSLSRGLPVPGQDCTCRMNCCCSIEYKQIKIPSLKT